MKDENLKKLIVITIISLLSTSFLFSLVISTFYFFKLDNISLRNFLILLGCLFSQGFISCMYLSSFILEKEEK